MWSVYIAEILHGTSGWRNSETDHNMSLYKQYGSNTSSCHALTENNKAQIPIISEGNQKNSSAIVKVVPSSPWETNGNKNRPISFPTSKWSVTLYLCLTLSTVFNTYSSTLDGTEIFITIDPWCDQTQNTDYNISWWNSCTVFVLDIL